MAFSLIAATVRAGTSTTGAIDTTAANLIILYDCKDTMSQVPTDSASNTWTPLTSQLPSGESNTTSAIYYCVNPTTSATHTFTSGVSYGAIAVEAWAGSASSPFDQENGNGPAGTNTSVQPGSVTPTQDNELVIAGVGLGDTNSLQSINGGFTISNSFDGVGGSTYGCGLAHLVQTSAAAANPTWSWTGASHVATEIATFKASGGTKFILIPGR